MAHSCAERDEDPSVRLRLRRRAADVNNILLTYSTLLTDKALCRIIVRNRLKLFNLGLVIAPYCMCM